MKAKLKVPRKSHKKKNEQEVEDFKEDVESHLLEAMGDTPAFVCRKFWFKMKAALDSCLCPNDESRRRELRDKW